MLDALFEYAEANQAVVLTPFILMGAMSPVTIPAALVQQIAEALTGIALAQTIRPGCPVIFGSFLSNIDMQSGSPTFGTPESGIGLLCTGQIARHFGLPFRSGGGLTSSQVPDAQAGYEALMTMLPTFLAGTNWVMHSAGWLEGGLVAGYEKFIVDIELLQMMQVEFTPLEIDEESMAFGAHEEVGSGGHFLGAMHTMERFRTCFYRPLLSSSENYERWMRNGGNDAAARATKIYQQKLEEYEQPPLDEAIRAGDGGVRRTTPQGARRLMGATCRFVLVLDCPDRPGIVHAVAGFLVEHGGNILESQQFGDRANGQFFMRIDFAVAGETTVDELRTDFSAVAAGVLHDLRAVGRRGAVPHPDHGEQAAALPQRPAVPPQQRLPADRHAGRRLQPSRRRDDGGQLRPRVPAHPGDARDQAEAEAELMELVDGLGIHLVVLARYMQVLSDGLCRQLSGRAINIHHSFLPSFKGAKPYHQAFDRGVKRSAPPPTT